jgi:hypothetical protein
MKYILYYNAEYMFVDDVINYIKENVEIFKDKKIKVYCNSGKENSYILDLETKFACDQIISQYKDLL